MTRKWVEIERGRPARPLRDTPTEVRDICGTGDTVFAALAVAMIAGKSLQADCRAAMGAAGRQVANAGIAAVAYTMYPWPAYRLAVMS